MILVKSGVSIADFTSDLMLGRRAAGRTATLSDALRSQAPSIATSDGTGQIVIWQSLVTIRRSHALGLHKKKLVICRILKLIGVSFQLTYISQQRYGRLYPSSEVRHESSNAPGNWFTRTRSIARSG